MTLRLPIFFASLLVFTSCSVTESQRCKKWRAEGDFYATQESCIRCLDTLGSGNKEAVKGCALGMDASKLLGVGER
jgi:hypothetical protein